MGNKKVKVGDKVSVHYVATFDDGEQFDSSYDRNKAIDIVVGQGMLIQGFENALAGMEEGEKKKIHLEAEHAYGPRDPNAIAELPKDKFPAELVENIEEGHVIPLSHAEHPGKPFPATATEVKEESIVFDLNHPLAGKSVNFAIEVMGITPEGMESQDEVAETPVSKTKTTKTKAKTTKKSTKSTKKKAKTKE